MSEPDATGAGASRAGDGTRRIVLVALAVCVVCSVLVATAAVSLAPLQERNRATERKRNILVAAGLLDERTPIERLFEQVETHVVDLETGRFTDAGDGPPSAETHPIDAADDLAGIGERERYATVYVVRDGGKLRRLVLPIYGKGLWSTIRGFVSLENDLNTVAGITFYEHAETPGLGGEIDRPEWRGKWEGKLLRDASGALRIEVIKGHVDPQRTGAEYLVDGISGATLTGRGVSRLVRYWLGEDGFGPFLGWLRDNERETRS